MSTFENIGARQKIFAAVAPASNIDAAGVERADVHDDIRVIKQARSRAANGAGARVRCGSRPTIIQPRCPLDPV